MDNQEKFLSPESEVPESEKNSEDYAKIDALKQAPQNAEKKEEFLSPENELPESKKSSEYYAKIDALKQAPQNAEKQEEFLSPENELPKSEKSGEDYAKIDALKEAVQNAEIADAQSEPDDNPESENTNILKEPVNDVKASAAAIEKEKDKTDGANKCNTEVNNAMKEKDDEITTERAAIRKTSAASTARLPNRNAQVQNTKPLRMPAYTTTEPLPTVKKPVVEEKEPEGVISGRGKTVFTVGLIVLSPVWVVCLLAVALFFVILYAAVFLADIALVVGVSLGSVVAIVVSLIGIVYGIIGLLPGGIESFEGFYELGLGLIIIGIVVVVGILAYHFVVKVTPILLRWITRFMKFTVKQIKILFKFIRRECGKL